MIRIVFDTNLFVSAILSPHGKSASILKRILESEFGLVMSHVILEEIVRVFRYPKVVRLMGKNGITLKDVDNLIETISKISIITPGKHAVNAIKDDPPDNMFLACAVEGAADFIISGDHHLTDMDSFENIKIVNPNDFLRIINNK